MLPHFSFLPGLGRRHFVPSPALFLRSLSPYPLLLLLICVYQILLPHCLPAGNCVRVGATVLAFLSPALPTPSPASLHSAAPAPPSSSPSVSTHLVVQQSMEALQSVISAPPSSFTLIHLPSRFPPPPPTSLTLALEQIEQACTARFFSPPRLLTLRADPYMTLPLALVLSTRLSLPHMHEDAQRIWRLRLHCGFCAFPSARQAAARSRPRRSTWACLPVFENYRKCK